MVDPVAPADRNRVADLLAGAAAGALFWIGLTLLGVPQLAGGPLYDLTAAAAALGALVAITPLRRLLYAATILVAVLVAVIAWTPLIDRPFRALARNEPVGAGTQAVVVLGADVTPDSLLHGQGLDRLLAGIELVKADSTLLLVLPGNMLDERGLTVPATPDQRRLLALAEIDPARVLVSRDVHSTHDEAIRARDQLRERGLRRVVVVTSPAHTRRACRTFERAGLAVTCRASISRDVPTLRGRLYRSADRLAAFRYWLYERVATAVYHMRGWI